MVESFFTVLTAERLLLGLSSGDHAAWIVRKLLVAEMAAIGLLAHVGLLVNTHFWRLHEPLDMEVAFFFFEFKGPSLFNAVP